MSTLERFVELISRHNNAQSELINRHSKAQSRVLVLATAAAGAANDIRFSALLGDFLEELGSMTEELYAHIENLEAKLAERDRVRG